MTGVQTCALPICFPVTIWGADHVVVTQNDPAHFKSLPQFFDLVLIDAPCSGTGVLKRNPDTLMKKTNASIDELIVIQNQLLDSYSSMVKPGGVLVYASCSILPSEGEDRIAQFLASEKGQNWTLDESRRWCPAKDGFDGFYGARLRRSP